MSKLQDRIAVVTGSGSGMGQQSALAFAREGALTYVVDIDAAAAEETVALIEAAGGVGKSIVGDVSDVDFLRSIVRTIEERHGVLHVLFNHAGIPGAAGLEAVTEQEWDLSVNVNMKSAFFLTMLAKPLLENASGRASIIYTASTAGMVASPYSPLYGMAKGGVVSFTRSVSAALAPVGIRANCICPGPIDTPMLPVFFGRQLEGDQSASGEIASFTSSVVPLGRAGKPEEIASAALFFACDDSSFVTGAILPVDGGVTAR